MAQDLVLRVAAGPNAGAEMPLGAGDWLIGTGEDADILLAEPDLAPGHLRLRVREGRVTAAALAPGVLVGGRPLPEGEETALEALEPLAIGGTVLAVGPAGASWSPRPPASTAPVPEVTPGPPAGVPAAAPAIVAPLAAPVRPVALGRRRRWPWVLAALLVLSAGGTGAVLLLGGTLDPPPAPGSTPRDVAFTARTVEGNLRREGLGEKVSVAVRGTAIALTGIVRDEEELRAAANAARPAGPTADFRVVTEARLSEQAATMLRAMNLDARLSIRDGGRAVLLGTAPDAARATEAIARLRADLPALRAVEDSLVTPDRAREWLDTALREAGLAGLLRTAASGRTVAVTGTLGPSGLAAWEGVSRAFAERHGDAVRLEPRLSGLSAPTVRGVRLGSAPALIMPDGRRLGIGDALEGAGRITGLDERRVRVRTPAGEVDIPYAAPPSWIIEERGDGR